MGGLVGMKHILLILGIASLCGYFLTPTIFSEYMIEQLPWLDNALLLLGVLFNSCYVSICCKPKKGNDDGASGGNEKSKT